MHRQLIDQWMRSVDSVQDLVNLTRSSMEQAQQQQLDVVQQYVEFSSRQFGFFWTLLSTSQDKTDSEIIEVHPRQGRLVLISNGSGISGALIARMLAEQGHRVIITYPEQQQDTARQLQQDSDQDGLFIESIPCDTSCFNTCEQIISEVILRHGPIDILINCASNQEDNSSVLDGYLDATFNIIRNVIIGMTERGFGRIINITPALSSANPDELRQYQAARAGIKGFSKALADELSGRGISVNIVSEHVHNQPVVQDQKPDSVQDDIDQELLAAVRFLLDEENSNVTGTNIRIPA